MSFIAIIYAGNYYIVLNEMNVFYCCHREIPSPSVLINNMGFDVFVHSRL